MVTRVNKSSGVSRVQSVTKMAGEKRRIKFPAEEELRLIHEVQKRPMLWDSTSENHSRADLRPHA